MTGKMAKQCFSHTLFLAHQFPTRSRKQSKDAGANTETSLFRKYTVQPHARVQPLSQQKHLATEGARSHPGGMLLRAAATLSPTTSDVVVLSINRSHIPSTWQALSITAAAPFCGLSSLAVLASTRFRSLCVWLRAMEGFNRRKSKDYARAATKIAAGVSCTA